MKGGASTVGERIEALKHIPDFIGNGEGIKSARLFKRTVLESEIWMAPYPGWERLLSK